MDDQIKQTAKNFLNALDKAIASGSWDETNFILIIGRKLREMRDDVYKKIQQADEDSDFSGRSLSSQLAMEKSLKEVFIGLYSIDGTQTISWELIIVNLPRQIVSRPVYASEDEIISIIKTKEKKINEAYVSVYVKAEDILIIGDDKIAKDKLGQKILVLKDNALNIDNINYFAHISGKYRYSRGKLIKLTPSN
jgi:intracellular multiplication protein IcmQ